MTDSRIRSRPRGFRLGVVAGLAVLALGGAGVARA
ncbi:MAG: hypothetical protein JWO14_1693, partial [Solirubrobacterales bacterium]|nr:hypothetical protein [Solirubrobacterales bacterium]